MTKPLLIVGIAGSLRSASYSRIVLKDIAAMLPPGTRFEWLDAGAFPHYNEDVERAELPSVVAAGRALVAACDAVIVVTPEFNHGIPGVLKNALDWLSRPAFSSCFAGRPVMFATVAPGALGGVRAQYQLRETFMSMLANVVPLQEIAITQVDRKIVDGALADEPTRKHIGGLLDRFLAVVRQG